MVGLVIVSHSATLAQGVAELVRGLPAPPVPIAAAGGLDLPDRPLGTDPSLVQRAIEQVYSEAGVLVLMDLGSAVLSAEMAVENLAPEWRRRVALCEAPLVEGAVAAAVHARLGASLDDVVGVARAALEPKVLQLGSAAASPSGDADGEKAGAAGHRMEIRATIVNRLGLHLRPAARFVQTARRFRADVRVANVTAGRGPVDATSINGVMGLGVRGGQEIAITASGPDAGTALAALRALVDERFAGDDRETPEPVGASPHPVTAGSLEGLPGSPGIALGVARIFRVSAPAIPGDPAADAGGEWRALGVAIEKTRRQIQAAREAVAGRAKPGAAAILDAHLLYLEDEALRRPAHRAIFEEGCNAAMAWQRATDGVAAGCGAVDDEYLRLRAADVREVGRQVIRNLLGDTRSAPGLAEPGILIAPDLSAADVAGLDPALVRGICTARGAPTSHAAILARSLGIPAVLGLGERLLALDGAPIIVDGDAGLVWPQTDPVRTDTYRRRAEADRRAQREARASAAAPAATRDGRRLLVLANIGSPADAQAALTAGADGVGLLRTEFLFLNRRTPPGEDEQLAGYRAAAEVLGGRPLVIRTLDAGGDKPVPWLALDVEANPFLGCRAVRLSLERPAVFREQLNALARVAVAFPVKVMFPMVATLDEWRRARALLEEARAELAARTGTTPKPLDVGIMVEVPAAALQAHRFVEEVDFFSIGTNDLTQYVLAAERGNPRVARLGDPFHPAVLRLIAMVVEAGQARRKSVGVCGELAGDPLAVPLLVGLGVDALSMHPVAIPRAKQIIRSLEYGSARVLAQTCVGLDSSEAVREQLRQARPC